MKKISVHLRAVIFVFVILFVTATFTTGCKATQDESVINTNNMPGNRFKQNYSSSKSKNYSRVVYLGGDDYAKNYKVGPSDVNFDFNNLK